MTEAERRDEPTATRRGLLLGAGAVGAGIVVSACGGKDAAKVDGPSSSGETSAKSASLSVKKGDVPVGGGLILKDSKIVVTQPKPAEFKAFSAVCTHRQCTVTTVADGAIDCPCHGSQFSVADGSVIKGPAEQPLQAKTVTAAGETLTIS